MVDASIVLGVAIGLVVIQRLAELRVAKRNEAWARDHGAREVGAGHYPAFFVLHIAWLIGWPLEASLGGPVLAESWWVWAGVFGLAQVIRYWAIASLGSRWNTRILVFDGARPLRRGPYRFVRHPNYIAVGLELLSVPMCFSAHVTAVTASLVNAVLLLGVRIPAENRALRSATHAAGSGVPN